MAMYITLNDLNDWVEKAILSDSIYHRERQILWEDLKTKLKRKYVFGYLKLQPRLFISIRTYLQARNTDLNNDAILAFNTAVTKLAEIVDSHLENEPDEPENKPKEEEEEEEVEPPRRLPSKIPKLRKLSTQEGESDKKKTTGLSPLDTIEI